MLLASVLTGCSALGHLVARTNSIHVETLAESAPGGRVELFSVELGREPRNAVFFVTGSGCASLAHYLNLYFRGLTGSWTIYAAQKAGVSMGDAGFVWRETFYEHYDYETLLARNRVALSEVLRRHGEVAGMVGVSEGGDIAAELMQTDPSPCSLVVIGAGGLSFRAAGAVLDQRHGGDTFAAAFAQIARARATTLPRKSLGCRSRTGRRSSIVTPHLSTCRSTGPSCWFTVVATNRSRWSRRSGWRSASRPSRKRSFDCLSCPKPITSSSSMAKT